MNKKLTASLYLYEKEAITSFDNLTVVSKDPVALAKMYSDKHADELIVYDLSIGDKEHEEALDMIKAICENVEIPVIGAGNVKRMEDVKKLLYAGCQKAVLNYSKDGNIAITGLELNADNSQSAYNTLVLNHEDFNIVTMHGQLAGYKAKDKAETF